MEVAWITGKHSIGSGTSICGRFDERVEQDVRNKDKVVNGISPINGWANGMYELEVGAVFEVLHGEQAKGLARVAGIS